MAHPPTYLNKLVLGGDDGRMLLLNINSEEVLFTFAGWGSAVRCVEASPALDVIGVGLADGRALLHNVRYDETLMTFANASGVGAGNEGLLGGGAAQAAHVGGGACTAISFRCDFHFLFFLDFFVFFFGVQWRTSVAARALRTLLFIMPEFGQGFVFCYACGLVELSQRIARK